MKITIKEGNDPSNIQQGDFLLIKNSSSESKYSIRQIVRVKGDYYAIDPEFGDNGMHEDSPQKLFDTYKRHWSEVIHVPLDRVELVIN